jgi:hypothetical protein
MCIISGPVTEVARTKILVAPVETTEGVPRQMTVYCNKVSMSGSEPGAMVLPFPTSVCEFYDLSAYPHLFKDLNKMCWPRSRSLSYSNSADSDSWGSPALQVVQNGNYKACVVPAMSDFDRLPHEVFQVKPEVIEFVKSQYPEGYSFVVCQLDRNKEYHPFAYMHNTLAGGMMFVPTLHYHQKSLHSAHHSDTDWDHEIYCWNRPLVAVPASFEQVNVRYRAHCLEMVHFPDAMERGQNIYAYRIHEYHDNHDLACAAA